MEHLVRVVLFSNSPQFGKIGIAIAGENVLLLRGVVLVEIGVVEALGRGRGDGTLHDGLGSSKDACVIGNFGPTEVNVDNCDRLEIEIGELVVVAYE